MTSGRFVLRGSWSAATGGSVGPSDLCFGRTSDPALRLIASRCDLDWASVCRPVGPFSPTALSALVTGGRSRLDDIRQGVEQFIRFLFGAD